jgi:hypothetical protein
MCSCKCSARIVCIARLALQILIYNLLQANMIAVEKKLNEKKLSSRDRLFVYKVITVKKPGGP